MVCEVAAAATLFGTRAVVQGPYHTVSVALVPGECICQPGIRTCAVSSSQQSVEHLKTNIRRCGQSRLAVQDSCTRVSFAYSLCKASTAWEGRRERLQCRQPMQSEAHCHIPSLSKARQRALFARIAAWPDLQDGKKQVQFAMLPCPPHRIRALPFSPPLYPVDRPPPPHQLYNSGVSPFLCFGSNSLLTNVRSSVAAAPQPRNLQTVIEFSRTV